MTAPEPPAEVVERLARAILAHLAADPGPWEAAE